MLRLVVGRNYLFPTPQDNKMLNKVSLFDKYDLSKQGAYITGIEGCGRRKNNSKRIR